MSAEALTEARRHPRTNTMLAGTIEFDGEQHPVFVRNLSVAGALIDGRCLPAPGDSVVLHRDDHRIPATVAWAVGNRCGLTFGKSVKVDTLIKRGKPQEATSSHQARVDAIQRALRENRDVPAFDETEAVVGAAAIGKRLVDEIGFAKRLIEGVNEALANDNYVLTRYGVTLQQLDEAEQMLRKLERELSAKGAPGRC